MKGFSGKVLLSMALFISYLSFGTFSTVSSAAELNNNLSTVKSELNVDKLLLVIRSIRERLPLNVDDVIEAYEQYTNLHKAQSKLARGYEALPAESELDPLEGSGDVVKQQETSNREYHEISSILNMKELKIICMNLFKVFGGDKQKSFKGRYSPKLVTKLEKAIEDLQ